MTRETPEWRCLNPHQGRLPKNLVIRWLIQPDRFVDMDFEGPSWGAVGPEGHESVAELIVDRPEGESVGFGQGQIVHAGTGVEGEAPFSDGGREFVDRPAAVKEEHQPMASAFIGFFGDHGEKVKFVDGQVEAGFLPGLPHRAFMRRFPQCHFQLSPDRAPLPLIGRAPSFDQQEIPVGMADEYQDTYLVGAGWCVHG